MRSVFEIVRDESGAPVGFCLASNSWTPKRMYALTCANCGGDLLAGRNTTVCERGCAIWHETPVDWLEKHHPERRIEHNTWGAIHKAVKEGAKKLAELDRNETEAK